MLHCNDFCGNLASLGFSLHSWSLHLALIYLCHIIERLIYWLNQLTNHGNNHCITILDGLSEETEWKITGRETVCQKVLGKA